MGKSVQIGLNGSEMWAYLLKTEDGLRMRLTLDEWQRMNIDLGRRLPVRIPGESDVWLFVTNVTELPPIVWVVMAKRVRTPV